MREIMGLLKWEAAKREMAGPKRPKGRAQESSLDNVHWTKHYSCNTVYGGSSLFNLGYSSAGFIFQFLSE